MVVLIRNYFPVIYDTRYSYVFSLYGTFIDLTKLKGCIHTACGKQTIYVSESPHYFCAIECLNNPKLIELLPCMDKNRLIEFIAAGKLTSINNYINYNKDYHPETDAIDTLLDFVALMNIFSTERAAINKKKGVLVRRRKGPDGKRFWLLIDGLHRSSILLALNQRVVNARVIFP